MYSSNWCGRNIFGIEILNGYEKAGGIERKSDTVSSSPFLSGYIIES